MTVNVLLADPILFPHPSPIACPACFPRLLTFDGVSSTSDEDFAEAAADADVLLVGDRVIGMCGPELAVRLRIVQRVGAAYDNLKVTSDAATSPNLVTLSGKRLRPSGR